MSPLRIPEAPVTPPEPRHVHSRACYEDDSPTSAPCCGYDTVGDPVEDIDNDEDFRQSSLDRLDLNAANRLEAHHGN